MALAPPATLTVESRLRSNTTKRLVPYPDFYSAILSNKTQNWADVGSYGYIGSPSPGVARIMAAVSTGMSIMAVEAPYPNSSYSIQFYGPCLKCQMRNNTLSSHDFDIPSELSVGKGYNASYSQLWDEFGGLRTFPRVHTYYNATAPVHGDFNLILMAAAAGDSNEGQVNLTC